MLAGVIEASVLLENTVHCDLQHSTSGWLCISYMTSKTTSVNAFHRVLWHVTKCTSQCYKKQLLLALTASVDC